MTGADRVQEHQQGLFLLMPTQSDLEETVLREQSCDGTQKRTLLVICPSTIL